jgi:hypothetical protein
MAEQAGERTIRVSTFTYDAFKQHDNGNKGEFTEAEVRRALRASAITTRRYQDMKKYAALGLGLVAAMCVVVGLMVASVELTKEFKDTNGVMTGKHGEAVLVGNSDMAVDASGALKSRDGFSKIRTGQSLDSFNVTSYMPDEALRNLRYFQVENPTSGSSVNLFILGFWRVAAQDGGHCASVVKFRTLDGVITLTGHKMEFSEGLAPIFEEAGFAIEGDRHLLGANGISGLFNTLNELVWEDMPACGVTVPAFPSGNYKLELEIYEPCVASNNTACADMAGTVNHPDFPSDYYFFVTKQTTYQSIDGSDYVIYRMESQFSADPEGRTFVEITQYFDGKTTTQIHQEKDGVAYGCMFNPSAKIQDQLMNAHNMRGTYVGRSMVRGRKAQHFMLQGIGGVDWAIYVDAKTYEFLRFVADDHDETTTTTIQEVVSVTDTSPQYMSWDMKHELAEKFQPVVFNADGTENEECVNRKLMPWANNRDMIVELKQGTPQPAYMDVNFLDDLALTQDNDEGDMDVADEVRSLSWYYRPPPPPYWWPNTGGPPNPPPPLPPSQWRG